MLSNTFPKRGSFNVTATVIRTYALDDITRIADINEKHR